MSGVYSQAAAADDDGGGGGGGNDEGCNRLGVGVIVIVGPPSF